MRSGQWLDCAGAMVFLPDAPDVEDERFELRTDADAGDSCTTIYHTSGYVERYHTLFDHDTDEDRAKQRAAILCGLLRREVWVVRVTQWDDGGDPEEECVAHYAFDEDEKTVGDA